MKIATSYFYQIRNFKPNMIPVSTAISDPAWYRPPANKEYYIDKRGIVCGLRYEPLIVQRYGTKECFGEHQLCPLWATRNQNYQCECMQEYSQLLETIDFDKMIKGFKFCANKFRPYPFDDGINDPIIVLMVYETPTNPCSERWALQNYFTSHGYECKELKYPI